MSQQPDQVVIAQAKRRPHCGVEVALSTQRLMGIYERIELSPITPYVTRVERYGGSCPCCLAQMRSLVNTAQRQGISAFDAIARTLTSHQSDWLLS